MREIKGGAFGPISSERHYREPAQHGEMVLNLSEILRILRRGMWIIIACITCAVLLSAFMVLRITPTYTAIAQIAMDQQNVADDTLGDRRFQSLELDNQKIASEIAVMLSAPVMSRVSEKLELSRYAEFNVALRPPAPEPSLLARGIDGLKGMVKALLGGGDAPPAAQGGTGGALSPVDIAAGAEARVLGAEADYVGGLYAGVRARQVGNSHLVNISFVSENPRIAAAVANTVADEYIALQREKKLASSGRVTEGLNASIDEMRKRLEDSEQTVISFRNQMLDSDTGGSERLEQQIRELSSRLVNVSAEHAELKAELAEIERVITESGVTAVAGVLESPVIADLRADLSKLRTREVEVRERFGDDSTRTAQIVEEIELTTGAIGREVERLRDDLRNKTGVARARELSLRAQLLEMEQRYLKLQKQQVQLGQLERESEARRVAYENILKASINISDLENLLESDAEVVFYASPPKGPSAPRKKLSLVLGFVGGAFFGLFIVFLRSFLDKTVATPEQLRRVLGGVPVVASLPLARAAMRRQNPLKFVSTNPNSPLMEAVRTLRNYLVLKPAQKGHTVALISSVPSEGKTSTSLLLAKSVVQMGMSCVVIDTDMRKGGIGEFLAVPSKPDLFDLLFDNAGLDQVLRRDPMTGAHVILSKPGTADPASLLYSEKMTGIIRQLEDRFDLVILDTAPLLPVTDALSLVRQADEVVMAVKWRGTPTDKISHCMDLLTEVGITPTCAVLTQADARQIPTYEYYSEQKIRT